MLYSYCSQTKGILTTYYCSVTLADRRRGCKAGIDDIVEGDCLCAAVDARRRRAGVGYAGCDCAALMSDLQRKRHPRRRNKSPRVSLLRGSGVLCRWTVRVVWVAGLETVSGGAPADCLIEADHVAIWASQGCGLQHVINENKREIKNA